MTTKTQHLLATTAAVAVLGCMTTACSGSSDSPTTSPGNGAPARAASDVEPLVLTIGTDDTASMPGALQIQHFADEVAERSGGAVTIRPEWHAAGATSHWDQAVAHLLMDGDLDLAMVPSRAWDDLGVTSLTALTAPFLIPSDTLTERVVSDPEISEQLTSGLPAVGVEALGLYPEGLRHPFGFHGRPLLGAGNYRGGVVRAAWSRSAAATFRALGATTDDAEADATKMIGAESSFRLTPAGIATGNVVFYPKVNVLTAASALHDTLTPEQWGVLQDAADATGAWVLDTLPTDAASARTFCSESGKIALASRAQLRGLVEATRGVVADLRKDRTTASIIDAVTALAADDPKAEPVEVCQKVAGDQSAALDGTYAFTVTPEAARAAGVTDQDVIDENTGDISVTFADGTWTYHQDYVVGPKAGTSMDGTGDYSFTGGRLTWYWSHEPGQWTSAHVDVAPDGSLTFSEYEEGTPSAENLAMDEVWFAAWERQDG
jgi:TRAP-type C4-dicarboxylate transport system substrate-binding protein